MKKLVVLMSCLSASFISFSQNNNSIDPPVAAEQSVFSMGPQGGFGHSYLIPYAGARFQPSWDAGVAMTYAPGVHWGIGLDIRYSAEGSRIEDIDNNRTTVIELKYIRIPLKAIYFFRKYENDFRPKISLGPAIGFLTGEVNSVNANAVDFGANASVGFHYRLVRAIWLTADVNYYQGLTDVYDASAERELNGNVRFDLGVNFGF